MRKSYPKQDHREACSVLATYTHLQNTIQVDMYSPPLSEE